MKKNYTKYFIIVLCLIFFICGFLVSKISHFLQPPSNAIHLARQPIIDKNGYSQGHILVTGIGSNKIALYNKDGYFEKIWTIPKKYAKSHQIFYGELTDDNKIILLENNKKFLNDPARLLGAHGMVSVYNNTGALETSFEDISLHHDIAIKDSSRIFALSFFIKEIKHKNQPVKIVDDSIIEIDLQRKKIVKRLVLSEYFPLPDKLPEPKEYYQNSVDIFHANAIDYIKENPINGNEAILLTMRNFKNGTLALIDLEQNKLLWVSPEGFFLYPHDGRFTKDKTITVFENGNVKRLKNRIFEMDVITNKIIWEYNIFKDVKGVNIFWSQQIKNWTHFSPYTSGVQKTEKGYLISSGMPGHIFEVSKDHKTVWELPAAASVLGSFTGDPIISFFKVRQYTNVDISGPKKNLLTR